MTSIKTSPTNWLDTGMVYGIKYALFTDKESFYAECARLGEARENVGPWIQSGKEATTHWLKGKEDRDVIALVCMSRLEGEDVGIRTCGLLCHEAVHIFQENLRQMGERIPSDEFMAYSIQWQAQQLMWEYQRQLGGGV